MLDIVIREDDGKNKQQIDAFVQNRISYSPFCPQIMLDEVQCHSQCQGYDVGCKMEFHVSIFWGGAEIKKAGAVKIVVCAAPAGAIQYITAS